MHTSNIHNFGLSGDQVSAIGIELDKVFQDTSTRPKEEFGIILGDFNCIAGDDRVFKVGSPPSASTTISSALSSGSRRAAWMKHLSLWTELAQPFHINSIALAIA